MPKHSRTDSLYLAFEDAWERLYRKCGPPMRFKTIITGEIKLADMADVVNLSYPVVLAALRLRKNGAEKMSDVQAKRYVCILQDLRVRLSDEVIGEPDRWGLGKLSRGERWYVNHDGSPILHALLSFSVGGKRKEGLDFLRIKKHAGAMLGACMGCIDSVNPARWKLQKGRQICEIMIKEGYNEYFYKKGYKERLVK